MVKHISIAQLQSIYIYIEKIYIPFFVKITIHEIACENNNA